MNSRGVVLDTVNIAEPNAVAQRGIDALARFWVRPNGFTVKQLTIRPLSKLPIAEQLFAAALRGDKNAFDALAGEADESNWEEFGKLAETAGFGKLVLDNCCEFGLLQAVPSLARLKLNRLAIAETKRCQTAQKRLAKLLTALPSYSVPLVWVKGCTLSLSVYDDPNHRSYSDFDVVVHPQIVLDFCNDLRNLGYERVFNPGFCNQYGVGPVDDLEDLFLTPVDALVPSSAITVQDGDGTMLDIKVAPFDCGLQFAELSSFFCSTVSCSLGGTEFLAPSLPQHLLIAIQNLYKERFISWKTMFDVHKLSSKLSEQVDGWAEFITLSKQESLESAAWAGLLLSINRFKTVVPPAVLTQLEPESGLLARLTKFSVSPYFVWNATSLPMMFAHAYLLPNGHPRKDAKQALETLLFPSAAFMERYYRGLPFKATSIAAKLTHWSLSILPGGAVRKLIGATWWSSRTAMQQKLNIREEFSAEEQAGFDTAMRRERSIF